MKPLEITPIETKVLDPLREESPAKNVTPNAARILSEYYGAVLTQEPDDIEPQILQGFEDTFKQQANKRVDDQLTQDFSDRIRQAVDAGEDPSGVIMDLQNRVRQGPFAAPHITLLAEGADLNDRDLRQLDRLARAQDIILRFEENQSKGVAATIGYFGDVMISDPLQNILGGVANLIGAGEETFEESTKRVELAKEAADLIFSDISVEEFETKFPAIIQRVADLGLFSENNPFAVDEFVAMVEEYGGGKVSGAAVGFQMLDIATAGFGTLIAKGARRLGNVPRVLAKAKGQPAAVRSAVKTIDSNPASPIVAELQPKLTRAADPHDLYLSAPDHKALRMGEANNWVLDYLKKFDKPSFTDPRIFKAKYADMVTNVRAKLGGHVAREIDADVVQDDFGNIVGVGLLGNSSAEPFVRKSDATKFANAVGGEVRETVDGSAVKYVVRKEFNLSTEGLARATDINKIGGAFASVVTSTNRNTTQYLDGVLKWGEGAKSRAIKTIGQEYRRIRSQTSKVERGMVDDLIWRLRDDPEYSIRKEPLTEREFIDHFVKMNGDTPSPQAKELYDTIIQLSDADYFLNADPLLKEAVENGETMVKLGDTFHHGKRVTLEAGKQVFDEDAYKSGKNPWRYLKEDEEVFAIKDFTYSPEGVGAVQFVAKQNPTERRLMHSDVLSYNVGGHRKYADRVSFFVKQEGSITLGNGTEVPRAPKTFMATRTEAEARTVVKEFNDVVDAIASGRPKSEIDEVIRKAENLPDTVTDLDSFKKFADNQGISWERKVDFAPDGSPTLISQGGKQSMFVGERTVDRVFRDSYLNRSRSVKPLIKDDGNPMRTVSPMRVVERNLASNISRSVDSAYLNQAGKGLLRTIEKLEAKGQNHVKNWKELAGKSAARQIEDMEFEPTEIGNKLARERDTIMRLVNRGSWDLEQQKRALGKAADFVYGHKDKFGKLGDQLSKNVDALSEIDYAGFTRAVAFHTKLGTLSPDQFMVQAMQQVNAIGISSAQLGFANALRTSAGGNLLQMAVSTNNQKTIDKLAEIVARTTPVSADDFKQLREWAIKTGRFIVDKTAIEENRDAILGGGVKARLENVSTTFFRAGEVNARAAAAMLNVAEMRKAGFKGNLLDEGTTRRMFNRQDILTASMTSYSAAAWQRSFLAIPLQFMTYNARIFEQLFTPDVLTGAERMRLGLTHLGMYGAAAVPFGGYYAEKYGVFEGAEAQADSTMFHAIRYGGMDAGLSMIVNAVGGQDTALSTRIGVGEGLTQFFSDFGTESLVELMIGPGGQIMKDGLAGIIKVVDGLAEGHSVDVQGYNLNRLGRIFSSYDDGFKLWAAATYGEYWTRTTGTVVQDNLNVVDGILMAAGVPMAEQQRLWSTVQFQQERKQNIEKVYNIVVELSRVADRAIRNGDYDSLDNVMDDVFIMIQGLPPGSRKEALRRIQRDRNLMEGLGDQLLKSGQGDLAARLGLLKGIEDDS